MSAEDHQVQGEQPVRHPPLLPPQWELPFCMTVFQSKTPCQVQPQSAFPFPRAQSALLPSPLPSVPAHILPGKASFILCSPACASGVSGGHAGWPCWGVGRILGHLTHLWTPGQRNWVSGDSSLRSRCPSFWGSLSPPPLHSHLAIIHSISAIWLLQIAEALRKYQYFCKMMKFA